MVALLQVGPNISVGCASGLIAEGHCYPRTEGLENPPRPPGTVELSAAQTTDLEIQYLRWADLSEPDKAKYADKVEDLFMQNFPQGTYKPGVIKKMLAMSTRGSELMSPTIVAINFAEEEIAGVMLPSRQLSSRGRLTNSTDPREPQVYRLIDAGKFSFRQPDTKECFDSSSIYIPAGVCRNPDLKYKGKGIPEQLYRDAINSLRTGVYANKVRYIATSHDLNNPASVKLHDTVGFADEFKKDTDFCYSQQNDGHSDKAMRFMIL